MDIDKFLRYDEENPDIWTEFESIALFLIQKGRTHYGAKAICEVIRYNTITRGNDEFKINNNFTMGYARKFISKYPIYKEFFELRERGVKR